MSTREGDGDFLMLLFGADGIHTEVPVLKGNRYAVTKALVFSREGSLRIEAEGNWPPEFGEYVA